MINTGYLGKYQGIPIYTISFKDFYALPKAERDTQELIYMIQEDRHVITGGKVFGNITIDGKRLNTATAALDWHITYAPMITKIRKEEEAKRIAEEEQAKAAEDKAAVMKIERPTVESLVKDTEKQLQDVKHVAENKVEDLHHEAEQELKEVAVKAEDAVQGVFETAVEVATDMAAESKKMLNQVAVEGAQQAEAVQVKSTTTTTRRKKKSTITTTM